MEDNCGAVSYPFGELLLSLSRRRRFWRGWLGRPYAYVLGPEGNEFVFANDAKFRWREAFEALTHVDGETSVIVSDGADHARRRGAMRPVFDRRAVAGYLGTLSNTAVEAVEAMPPEMDAYREFRSTIRRANLRAMFGERVAGDSERLGELLQPLIELADLVPQRIDLHRRLRSPRWRRAEAARGELDRLIYAEIGRAREGDAPPGALRSLVEGRDKEGQPLSDLEVRDQMVTLIAAGYETTSAAMAWTLYSLGGRLDAMRRARAEAMAADSPAAIDQLPFAGAVVQESLRLHPPAPLNLRLVGEETSFQGHRLRPGTYVVFSAYATHRDERVFDAPRQFRPERWLEAPKPSPSRFLTFGGGAHRCIGSELAKAELTIMLAALLRRAEFRVLERRVRARGLISMRPARGLRIRLVEETPARH